MTPPTKKGNVCIFAISPGSACTFSKVEDSELPSLFLWHFQIVHGFGD